MHLFGVFVKLGTETVNFWCERVMDDSREALIPVPFFWPYGGSSVFLCGSFNRYDVSSGLLLRIVRSRVCV